MRDPRKQKDKNTANYVLRGKKVLNFIGKGLMSWRRLPGPNLESLSLVCVMEQKVNAVFWFFWERFKVPDKKKIRKSKRQKNKNKN
jgi:hypothetical protein